MYVDALTLAAVADEWRALLIGARIDTIIQPTEHAIALQCYTPGSEGQPGRNSWLYLSAHPQLARAHLTALKPPKIASEPPPFVMLLRKHLEGVRIESIAQPRWERVLEIVAGYRKSPESDERVRFRLIIEIMGRLSNIILVDEQGMILGSLRRVGAEVNRYRTIAANVPYLPPPPQQRLVAGQALPRLEPTTVTAAQLSISTAAEEEEKEAEVPAEHTARRKAGAKQPKQAKLWQLLTRHLLGFSPLSAKEAVFRTTGDAETVLDRKAIAEETWEELAWNVRFLAALYDTHVWQPQLVERVEHMEHGEARTVPVPVAFASYVLEQYAEVPGMHIRSLPSMNAVLDEFYARAEWRDAMEDVRAPIRKALQTHLERGRRKAELLQQELAKAEEAAQYRLQAELLLAHQHEVQQGQTSIALPNFYAESDAHGNLPEVTIPLDPRFDAVSNANRLFNRYHKLRRATELVPAQIEQNAVELATIEQLLADLMLAETPAEVALVKAEVQTAGYMRGAPEEKRKAQKNQKAGKKGGKQGKGKPTPPGGGVPLHVQSREGFTLLIGKNSRQNEDVTFHQAAPNDLWLHARGVPGAHVIIRAAGREIPRSTIEQAASLAAYYSQARGSTSVPVDYTLQRHIRHMKGGGPGMVIYERERTIYVEPRGAE
jgi:predicted ribosome quality control (RQC) complex YloA/Tae2 family protein